MAVLVQTVSATENFAKLLEHVATTDIRSVTWNSARSHFPDIEFGPQKSPLSPTYLFAPEFEFYWEGTMKKPAALSPDGATSGRWFMVLKGGPERPEAIDIAHIYNEVDATIHHLDALQNGTAKIEVVKCPPEKELLTFGNTIYRIELPNTASQLIKESWACGNRACTQIFSFFGSPDYTTGLECSGSMKP